MISLYVGVITAAQRGAIGAINGHNSRTATEYYQKIQRQRETKDSREAFTALSGHQQPATSPVLRVVDRDIAREGEVEARYDDFDFGFDDFGAETMNSNAMRGFAASSRSSGSAWAGGGGGGAGSRLTPPRITTAPRSTGNFAPPEPVAYGQDHPWVSITDHSRRVPWSEAEVDWVGQWCIADKSQNPEKRNTVARCLKALRDDASARRIFHNHHVFDSARLRVAYDKFKKRKVAAAQQNEDEELDVFDV